MDAINRKVNATNRKDQWKVLVRETLIHVYGSKISLFSAKGSKVNSRPPINGHLFNGLLGMILNVLRHSYSKR